MLDTIQNLDERILKNTKARDIKKSMILQRNFGWNCLSLEDAKSSGHTKTSPSFIQDNNNVKSNEGVEVKLPKLELK